MNMTPSEAVELINTLNKVNGHTLLPLSQSLTAADNGSNAVFKSLQDFLIHSLICLRSNAAELFAQADIDGGLVGGASLKPDFGKIVNYK